MIGKVAFLPLPPAQSNGKGGVRCVFIGRVAGENSALGGKVERESVGRAPVLLDHPSFNTSCFLAACTRTQGGWRWALL